MRYREEYIKRVAHEAIAAYNGIHVPSRKLPITEVAEKYGRNEDYAMFLSPVNKLVEMGELDFDSQTSLEGIVRLIRKKF